MESSLLRDKPVHHLNAWMKKEKKEERHMNLIDKFSVSQKAKEKIEKIIKEDRKPKNRL